jgi:ABC-type Mn2+/Zn2+ transport system ATPase subunit
MDTAPHPSAGNTVLDQLLCAQYARKVPGPRAVEQAATALRRVDAQELAHALVAELRGEDEIRIALARAVVSEPSMMMIDEPFYGLDPTQRTAILELMRQISNGGTAMLTCTSEAVGMIAADRVLTLNAGTLRGETTPQLADITHLAQHRHATR